MNAQEIINYIATAPKKTPVKMYVNLTEPVDFTGCGAKVFGEGLSLVVFGNWADLEPVVTANAALISDIVIENDRRNSGVPLLDIKNIRARIEPGAVIREKVEIGEGAVIMMGAVINIGAVVGEGTMIDMGAVLGGRAIVGKRCHIGAGTVLAASSSPLRHSRRHRGRRHDRRQRRRDRRRARGPRRRRGRGRHCDQGRARRAPSWSGNPARIIKMKDEKTEAKTALIDALRTLD